MNHIKITAAFLDLMLIGIESLLEHSDRYKFPVISGISVCGDNMHLCDLQDLGKISGQVILFGIFSKKQLYVFL